MMDIIESLDEAKKQMYGRVFGKNTPYKPGKCVYGVFKDYRTEQCSHKNGKGPGGLYCGIHDPIARKKKDDERYAKYTEQLNAQTAARNFANAASSVCRGVDTAKLQELGHGWLKKYLEEKGK